MEVRNLIEHGNIEGRQRPDSNEEQQEAKPFPGPEDDSDEVERNFPIPIEIRNIIHQVKSIYIHTYMYTSTLIIKII